MAPEWPERVNVVIKNEQFTSHQLIKLTKIFIKMPLISAGAAVNLLLVHARGFFLSLQGKPQQVL